VPCYVEIIIQTTYVHTHIHTYIHTHIHTYIHTYVCVCVCVCVCVHEVISKSFRTESIMKYMLTTINTRWEATQRVMAAKFTRLTHKIAIQLHLVAKSCTICISRSRWPVRKLLDTPSCVCVCVFLFPSLVAVFREQLSFTRFNYIEISGHYKLKLYNLVIYFCA
jgi:hypothetical protein